MTYLTKEKSYQYAFTSMILFITNILMLIITYNNPLKINWLLITYIIISLISMVFLCYVFMKNNILNEDIKTSSKTYKIFDYIGPLMVMLSLFFMIFGNIVGTGEVDGISMDPTLHTGQDILIYKYSYKPKRNDIIIIQTKTTGKDRFIIKRTVAVPGDKIRFYESAPGYGFIFINDEMYKNQFLEKGTPTVFTRAEYEKMVEHEFTGGPTLDEVTLSEGYYIALGDNFKWSVDSRDYGAFHISNIGGKLIFKFGGE